ncbi:protein of unknown function [Thauera humireducens]|nr:protein of unknown function [Thauera humireducens]
MKSDMRSLLKLFTLLVMHSRARSITTLFEN